MCILDPRRLIRQSLRVAENCLVGLLDEQFYVSQVVIDPPFMNGCQVLNSVGKLSTDLNVLVLTSPSFCTSSNERVYITASGCEIGFGGAQGLQAAGAGGL